MTQAFNRDCMDAMKEYPDKYFDLAVVDPPYGINVGSQPGGGNREYIPFGGTRNQEYEAIKRERERERRESEEQNRLVKVGGWLLSRPKATPPSMIAPYRRRGISKNWSEYQNTALSLAEITFLTT